MGFFQRLRTLHHQPAMFHPLMIMFLMRTVHSVPVAKDIHIHVDASGSRSQGMIPNIKRKEEMEDGPIPTLSVSERPGMTNEMDVVEDDAVHIWPWKHEKEDDNEDEMR